MAESSPVPTLLMRPADTWADENGWWQWKGLIDTPPGELLTGFGEPQVLVVVEDPAGDWHEWTVPEFTSRVHTSMLEMRPELAHRRLPGELPKHLSQKRRDEVTQLADFLTRFRNGEEVLGVRLVSKREGRAACWRELSARLLQLGFTGVSPSRLQAKDLLLRRHHDDPNCLLEEHERRLDTDPLDREPADLVEAARRYFDTVPKRSSPNQTDLFHGLNNFLRDVADLDPESYFRAARKRVVRELSRSRRSGADTDSVKSKQSRPKGVQGRWRATLPFESLQLDAWRVDCEAYDQHGNRILRLYMLTAVDAVTRAARALRFVPGPPTMADVRLLVFDTVKGRPIWPVGEPASPRLPDFVDLGPELIESLQLENADFQPVGTLHVDNGSEFIGRETAAFATSLTIHMQPARPGRGSDKPHVESFFGQMADFVRGFPGSTGNRSTKRGEPATQLLHVPQLEVLLRMWVESGYHNTPHEGLTHPDYPGQPLSPRRYEILLLKEHGALPLGADPYAAYGLLPRVEAQGGFRVVHDEGLRNRNRDYDTAGTDRMKEYSQSAPRLKGRGLPVWEHPYDPAAVVTRAPNGELRPLPHRDLNAPRPPLQDALEEELRALLQAESPYRTQQFGQLKELLYSVAKEWADANPPVTRKSGKAAVVVAAAGEADAAARLTHLLAGRASS